MGGKHEVLAITAHDLAFLKWLSQQRRTSMMQLVRDAVTNEYYEDLQAYEDATGRKLVGGLWLVEEQGA